MTIQYRQGLPKGNVDIVIVSLVHQGSDMIKYMVRNIQKYVEGKYMLFIHYNGREDINENELPEWVWLNREPLLTDRCSRTMVVATCDTLKFALDNLTFTNVLILSSGSAFYRTYIPPTQPYVGIITHETILYPNSNFLHISPISTEHAGKVSEYLTKNGGARWQYENSDKDVEFLNFVKERNFKWFKGCQFTGQVWPREVGEQIVSDILTLKSNVSGILSIKNNPHRDYAYEEIYFSTYAYNYALEKQIAVSMCEVITDWHQYDINDPQYIIKMRNYKEIGHALCKLPDNIKSITRQFLEQ